MYSNPIISTICHASENKNEQKNDIFLITTYFDDLLTLSLLSVHYSLFLLIEFFS